MDLSDSAQAPAQRRRRNLRRHGGDESGDGLGRGGEATQPRCPAPLPNKQFSEILIESNYDSFLSHGQRHPGAGTGNGSHDHPGPQRGREQPEGALTGLGTNFADAARIGVATVGYVSVKQRNRVRGAHRSGDEIA